MESIGASALAIEPEHTWLVGALPRIHRDPFDRILIAQANSLGLTVITSDPILARYPVATLLVP
jgi:PIN domain nuclease of toxin-antitoxin system